MAKTICWHILQQQQNCRRTANNLELCIPKKELELVKTHS
jgi:hypothetical protein